MPNPHETPSAAEIILTVNGTPLRTQDGATIAAVLLNAGIPSRQSVTGEPRTALCGMGICFECRATVDGRPHTRTCQLPARNGMVVETNPQSDREPSR